MPAAGRDSDPTVEGARPLRLLVFYNSVFPEMVGGVEHRNFELAAALARRGHSVTLAAPARASSEPFPGVHVEAIAPPLALYSAGRRSTLDAVRLAAYTRRLDLRSFDAVETANMPYLHIFPLALACAWRRKPLVVSWYEYWGSYWRDYLGGGRWVFYALIEWVSAQVGTVAVASSALAERSLGRHRLRGATTRIPCGIDCRRVEAAAHRAAASGPPLIYSGRLLREKRLDLLLEAVAILARRLPAPILAVTGDGPDRDRFQQRIGALGLEDFVLYHGHLAEAEAVWEKLGAARLAVQPSSREGFGLFPLEAMAAGLPVVYCESRFSAVEELVRDGIEGRRVPADASALAAAVQGLLDDETERRRLGDNARRRAADYDWSKIAFQMEELLLTLGRRRSRPPRRPA